MAIAPLPPHHREIVREKWVLAADLGQSTDPTALCVLHHKNFRHMSPQGRVTEAGDAFDVRHLARLPLGLSYLDQVGEVANLLARPPLNAGCDLVIDETGVGRAVADLFEGNGMRPHRVTITAGIDQTGVGARRWHVPKGVLISTLDARLHTGELRFAADLREAGAMAEELQNFTRHVSAAGRFSYAARQGKHDDLVLSVALALWVCVGLPKSRPAMAGRYTSTRPTEVA